MIKWFAITACLFLGILQGQSRTDRGVCDEIVTTLVPQRVFKIPTKRLLRVEIRSCMPGLTENLQFVAWENGATKPSLVLTTSDETIVQLVMSGGVFVIETTGGSHSDVFVILYDGGTSGLSQSNYYYEGNVFFMCPLLLNRSRYPNNNAPI